MNLSDIQKLYTDVVFAIDGIADFVPKEKLKTRKYVKYESVLKSCQEDFSEYNKLEIQNIINQIQKCTTCQCFKCSKDCIMEGCGRCENSGYISRCDNDKITVYRFNNKTLTLKNQSTTIVSKYNVLSILKDEEYKQFFILLELNQKKYIVYYYPEISGDILKEIKDVEDFNFAVRIFNDSEVQS